MRVLKVDFDSHDLTNKFICSQKAGCMPSCTQIVFHMTLHGSFRQSPMRHSGIVGNRERTRAPIR